MKHEITVPAHLRPDIERLEAVIRGYGSMVVAFSGGVDSGLLAYVAHRVLGARALAVIGISASLGSREKEAARRFLEGHGIPHGFVETEELSDERYRRNGPDRCYYCKTELFAQLRRMARERGFDHVAYGANMDDARDYRPGARAAGERAVVSPLSDAGLGKEKIRSLARALGLELWDKPASPCLASRIPYREPVTARRLAQVEAAENALKDLGFHVCRVRHHGASARIEVPVEDHGRLLASDVWEKVMEKLTRAGFRTVTVEPDGFRSGRLNDAIR